MANRQRTKQTNYDMNLGHIQAERATKTVKRETITAGREVSIDIFKKYGQLNDPTLFAMPNGGRLMSYGQAPMLGARPGAGHTVAK